LTVLSAPSHYEENSNPIRANRIDLNQKDRRFSIPPGGNRLLALHRAVLVRMDGCILVPVIWDMSVDLDQRRLLGARRNVAKGALLSYWRKKLWTRTGSAKQVKGTVKQVVGKVVGDTKLQSEG
jgi:hypothetical protein